MTDVLSLPKSRVLSFHACGCLGVYVTLNCDCELEMGMNVSLMIFHFSLWIQSKRKATDTEEEDDQSEKKYRKCEKAGCSAMYPVCFASASER